MGTERRAKHARVARRLSVAVVSVLAAAGASTFGLVAVLSPAPAASAATLTWSGVLGNSAGLAAVSCPSVVTCQAVGSLTNVAQNFTFGWNGIFWESSTTINAALQAWQPLAVSCVSGPYFCAAVGGGVEDTTSGGGWTNVPSPNTSGTYTGTLSGVSCTSASFCVAVGAYTSGPLVEQWNGLTWSVVPSPLTGVTPGNNAGVLSAVSCTSPSSCMAVGSVGVPSQTLTEQWNGTTWSILPSPNTDPTVNNELTGVSCPSSSACTAVGVAINSGIEAQALIEQWNGTAWSMVSSPNPAPKLDSYNQLSAVSCPSLSACTAVGQTTSTPSPAQGPFTTQSLVEQWDGTTWSLGPIVNTTAGFTGVSCVTAATCVAVGSTPGIATSDLTFVGHGGDAGPIANTGPVTVTGLSPVSGPAAGGTPITITGTGFTGTQLVTFANGSLATNVVVVNDSTITATTPSGPGTSEGFVRVTTPLATSPPAASSPLFTWLGSPTGSAPTVTSLSPSSGPTTGGTVVTVKGAVFNGATQVFFGSVASTSFSVSSSTTILAAAPAEAAGAHDVTVTTGNGTSAVVAADQFTAVTPPPPPPPPAPTVTSVSPASGSTTGGTSVTVKGTGFTGATKVLFGSVPAASFSVSSSTKLAAVSPAEGAGTHDVLVTTTNGTSAAVSADQFTSVAPPPAPVPAVTSISPTSGPSTGGTSVTIKGTGFNGGTQVLFGTVPATSFSVSSSTRITAVAPAQGAGWHNVFVTTSGGTSAAVTADEFTYVLTPPAVTSLSTSSGSTSGGTSVTIRGTGFSGATQVLFGSAPATSFTVMSSTKIAAVAPAGTSGTVDVVVITPSGTSAATSDDQFTYRNNNRGH
jgi:large repetitive protein